MAYIFLSGLLAVSVAFLPLSQADIPSDEYVSFSKALRAEALRALEVPDKVESHMIFSRLIENHTDYQGLYEFAMRPLWSVLTEDEKSVALPLFRNMLAAKLSGAFERIDLSQSIEFRSRSVRLGDDFLVSAELGRAEKKSGIDIKFVIRRMPNGSLRLANAKVMGLDLALHLRSEVQQMAQPSDPSLGPDIPQLMSKLSMFKIVY